MEVSPLHSSGIRPLRPTVPTQEQQVERAEEIQEAYRDFVGKTFFGQLLKAMRQSVGKPAYFHGGRAEEVFRGQLDQTLADHMTEASADTLADPMFKQQFPEEARILAEANQAPFGVKQLGNLRRR